jgi:hypothetical protein
MADFELWLEFEQWTVKDGDDLEDECSNAEVVLADGQRFSLNVWTYKYLMTAVEDARLTNDHLGGSYLLPPDLLVQRLDRSLLEAVVSDMIARELLPLHCRVTTPRP